MKAFANVVNEISGGCLAARVRVIARTVTAIYEEAIRPYGLTIAQVNLLAALGRMGPCAPSQLGEKLQLERSTVSRNLDLLLKSRWVRATASDAKGKRVVELTASGEQQLRAVLPGWRQAQAQAARMIGERGVRALQEVAERVWSGAPPSTRKHSKS